MARTARVTAALAGILFLLGLAFPASASLITIGFSGHLTGVDTPLAGGFTVGQSFSGSYTFRSDTSDVGGSPFIGVYPLVSFDVTIGSFAIHSVVTLPYPFDASIINIGNNQGGVFDIYRVDVDVADSGTPQPVGAEIPVRLELQFTDLTNTALSDNSLLLTAPSFADFAFNQHLRIDFRTDVNDPGTAASINGQLDAPLTTTVVPTDVPEPASAALTLAGLLGTISLRRRRRRDE
jgi:hypothetical protein